MRSVRLIDSLFLYIHTYIHTYIPALYLDEVITAAGYKIDASLVAALKTAVAELTGDLTYPNLAFLHLNSIVLTQSTYQLSTCR